MLTQERLERFLRGLSGDIRNVKIRGELDYQFSCANPEQIIEAMCYHFGKSRYEIFSRPPIVSTGAELAECAFALKREFESRIEDEMIVAEVREAMPDKTTVMTFLTQCGIEFQDIQVLQTLKTYRVDVISETQSPDEMAKRLTDCSSDYAVIERHKRDRDWPRQHRIAFCPINDKWMFAHG